MHLCHKRWSPKTAAIGSVDEVHPPGMNNGLKANDLLIACRGKNSGLKLDFLIFNASESLLTPRQRHHSPRIKHCMSAVNLAKTFYRQQRIEQAFSSFYDEVIRTDQNRWTSDTSI